LVVHDGTAAPPEGLGDARNIDFANTGFLSRPATGASRAVEEAPRGVSADNTDWISGLTEVVDTFDFIRNRGAR